MYNCASASIVTVFRVSGGVQSSTKMETSQSHKSPSSAMKLLSQGTSHSIDGERGREALDCPDRRGISTAELPSGQSISTAGCFRV